MQNFATATYEDASKSITSGLKQIVQTAILFDSFFKKEKFIRWEEYDLLWDSESGNETISDIEETSIQIVIHTGDPLAPTVNINRNFHSETQRIFGFQSLSPAQIHHMDDDEIHSHLCLMHSALAGPKYLDELLDTHYVFASFTSPIDASYSGNHWTGASLSFTDIFIAQKKISLAEQRTAASNIQTLVNDLDELDVMSKMHESYEPYLDLLK